MAKQSHKQSHTFGPDYDSGFNFTPYHHHPTPQHHPDPEPPHHSPPGIVAIRTVDGSGNNLANPDLNALGSDLTRLGPAHFADGEHAMIAAPNPRDISNIVVSGNGDLANPEGLSGMMYAWGQFIDHDLDMMRSGGADISIIAPADDPDLPGATIGLTRVIIDPNTGEGTGIPATAVNSVTGWLDASMVYGSDPATAASLRMADGHMKTSAGDYLPIVNGMFAAGDVRVSENPDLTALQTLFVREHNYQVDLLHKEHPNWTGEQLYQQAKAIVTAEIAHITYSEFLPHLLGANALQDYHGYDPTVDATISEEFAGAAYRLGHSIVSAEIASINEQGEKIADQDLKDVFFEPAAVFTSTGDGADGLLRHLGADLSNALDVHIVDDLRNFLFDPGEGQDLASINIQRGHDLGLGSLNETRVALGLEAYTSFDQITSDQDTAAALAQAYSGDINTVDLWTGGLAEDHVAGAMVGQTFETIIAGQFEALRDGDRFWYENQGFDQKTLALIESTTLSDIIVRNTNTEHMQDDAFVFYDRHTGTAGGVASEDPDAPQLVIGSDGIDTLVGGPQNDVLVAGTGHQTLTGLAGADTFVFDSKGATNALITDFEPGVDHLEFDNAGKLTAHDVHIKADHGNTVLDVGSDHIVLVGVNPNQLSIHEIINHDAIVCV
jgi:Ca2+-binding RTX toxin-like protein